jgi:hypothetical protein
MQDMHVPSATRGGVGSSSHAPTGSRDICTIPTGSRDICTEDEDEDDDDDHEDVDQGHKELGPSQLEDAP